MKTKQRKVKNLLEEPERPGKSLYFYNLIKLKNRFNQSKTIAILLFETIKD